MSGEARTLAPGPLVVASHNPGKVREIADLLAPLGYDVRAAGELGLDAPEETGSSFAENARIKARAAATASGLPALADDSGLEVAALGGAPGIHSARWAGGGTGDFTAAMARIRREMTERGSGVDSARFVCALALCWPDGHCETVEGTVRGRVVFPPRGRNGFGYDPIFVPEGGEETFGEMAPGVKHAISHRADAFRRMRARCLTGAP